MTISVELVTAIGAVLTSLLGSIAVLLASRSRRIGEDTRTLRRTARQLRDRYLIALDHIFQLEQQLAEHGLRRPPRPPELEADEDDDEPPAPRITGASAPA